MKLIKTLLLLLILGSAGHAQLLINAHVDHLEPDGTDTLGNIFLDVSGSTSPYTYSWTPNGVITRDLANIHQGSYAVRAKSATGDSVDYVYSLGYKTKWANVSGGYFRNDSLLGTAVSKNSLLPHINGWMEYVETSASGNEYFIGFSDSLSPINNAGDIDFGIYATYSNRLYAWESGYDIFLAYCNIGDVVRIERMGDTVNYKINGVLYRSLIISGISAKTMKLRARLENPLANIGCSFIRMDSVSFDNYVTAEPLIIHSSGPSVNDGSISLSPDFPGLHTYTWQPGSATTSSIGGLGFGTYTTTLQDSSITRSSYEYHVGYKTQWTNVSGYSRHDSLSGNAVSKNSLPPNTDGWMEYIENDSYGTSNVIGFVDSLSPIGDLSDIKFGLYSYFGVRLYSLESGYASVIAYPEPGSVMRVERVGDTVSYKRNGALLRSVVISGIAGKTMKLKASFEHVFANIGCSFMHTDSVAFDNYVLVKPVIVHSSGPSINDGGISVSPVLPGTDSYTWQPGAATTSSIGGLGFGTYTATVQDSSMSRSSYRYHVGYKTTWTNVSGYSRHDSLLGSAISENSLLPYTNGWMEYVQNNSYGYHSFIGFSDSLCPIDDPQDIDFGFYNYAGIRIFATESGYAIPIFSPADGDIIRLERVGDTIHYMLNGVVMHTTVAPGIASKTFKLRTSLGYPLVNIGCSFMNKDSIAFPNLVQVQPVITHASGLYAHDGSISLSPSLPGPQSYTWSPGSATTPSISALGFGTYGVRVQDSLANQSRYHYNIGYKVKWTNVTGGYFRNDTLIGEARSKNELSPNTDGWLEFVERSQYGYDYYIGFSDSIIPGDISDIDFGLFSYLGIRLYSWENGSAVPLIYPAKGNIIRVERIGDTVNYKIDGIIFRSVVISGISAKKMKLRASLSAPMADFGCSFFPHIDPIVTSTDYADSTHLGELHVTVPNGTAPFNVVWKGNKFPSAKEVYHDLIAGSTGLVIDSVAFMADVDSIKQQLDYTGLEPGIYPMKIYDAENDSLELTTYIESPAVWTYTTGVSIDTSLIGLKKWDNGYYMYGIGHRMAQQGTFSAGNHFAVSGKAMDAGLPYGLSFNVPSSTEKIYVGLRQRDSVATGDTTDIYAHAMFRFNGDRSFNIIFNDTVIYTGLMRSGDHFSIKNVPEDGQLEFYMNGEFLAEKDISAINTAGGLQAKLILGSAGASIGAIKEVSSLFKNDMTALVKDATCANPLSGSIAATGLIALYNTIPLSYQLYDASNTLLTTIPITTFPNTVTFTGLGPGTYTVKYNYHIQLGGNGHLTRVFDVAYQPGWTNIHNIAVSPSDNSLTRSTAPGTGNAGAFSNNVLNASATATQWLEWSAPLVNIIGAIGLSYSDINQAIPTINYYVKHIQSGAYRMCYLFNGSTYINMSPYSSSDILRLAKTVVGSNYNIEFRINNILKGQILSIVNADLYADASIPLGIIRHPRMSFNCSAVICDPAHYAVLHSRMDGGYYTTCSGLLYFTIDGDYSQGPLNYKVYNSGRSAVTGLSISSSVLANGDNRYTLDVNSLSLGYYMLEVVNQKKEKLTLRFKR